MINKKFIPILSGAIEKHLLYSGKRKQYCIYITQNDRYLRVSDEEADFILSVVDHCDGKRNIDEILQKYDKDKQSDIVTIISKLASIGAFTNCTSEKQFSEINLFSKTIFSFNTNISSRILSKFYYPYWIILILMLVITTFYTLYYTGASYYLIVNSIERNVSFLYYIISFLFIAPLFAIHEFSHMVTAAKCGLRTSKLNGVLYFLIFPVFYVKIAGIYKVKEKSRLKIFLAGVITNFILAIIFYNLFLIYKVPVLYSLAISNLQITLVNLIPFNLTDGYFVFSTLFKETNLRRKYFAFISDLGRKKKQLNYSLKNKIYIIMCVSFMLFFLYIQINIYIGKLFTTYSILQRTLMVLFISIILMSTYILIIKLRTKQSNRQNKDILLKKPKFKNGFYQLSYKVNTLKELIKKTVDIHSELIAVRFIDKNNNIIEKTYNQLYIDICKAQVVLNKLSVTGNRIAIMGDSSYQWIVTYFAITISGGVVVPVDKDLNIENIYDIFHECEIRYVFYDNNYISKINQLKEKIDIEYPVLMKNIDDKYYWDSDEKVDLLDFDINPDKLAVIIYTSGTTTKPKGVMLTHKNITHDIQASQMLVGRKTSDVVLSLLPIHHSFSQITGIFTPLYFGGTVCISRGIKYAIEDLKYFNPTTIIIVPMIAQFFCSKIEQTIIKNNQQNKINFLNNINKFLLNFHINISKLLFKKIILNFGNKLDTIICGGSYLGESCEKKLTDLGLNLLNGYGITECSPVVSCNIDRRKRLGSVGVVHPFCDVKIINDEIHVKGSIVTQGYINDKEMTKNSFYESWFKTGDLGFIDDDGYLHITGRSKDVIILENGKNISPLEIENLLKNNVSLIKEVIVCVKIINDINLLTAIIYPVNQNGFNLKDIEKNIKDKIFKLNKNLPLYKQIKNIEISKEELEKTSTGKIKRNTVDLFRR